MVFGITNKETNKQAKKVAKKSPFYWCKEESVRYRGGDYMKQPQGGLRLFKGDYFVFLLARMKYTIRAIYAATPTRAAPLLAAQAPK